LKTCKASINKKKNCAGGETPPTSMKEKETQWSEVPYVYPTRPQRLTKLPPPPPPLQYLDVEPLYEVEAILDH